MKSSEEHDNNNYDPLFMSEETETERSEAALLKAHSQASNWAPWSWFLSSVQLSHASSD